MARPRLLGTVQGATSHCCTGAILTIPTIHQRHFPLLRIDSRRRYSSFLSSMDPSTLLASDDDVRAAMATLDAHQSGNAAAAKTDEELWAAHKLVSSAVHPDTRELIPRPVRMAGYGVEQVSFFQSLHSIVSHVLTSEPITCAAPSPLCAPPAQSPTMAPFASE